MFWHADLSRQMVYISLPWNRVLAYRLTLQIVKKQVSIISGLMPEYKKLSVLLSFFIVRYIRFAAGIAVDVSAQFLYFLFFELEKKYVLKEN